MITVDILNQIAPNGDDDIIAGLAQCLDEVMNQYEINTPLRQAHFIAQAAHESGGFGTLEENLNYSASGLQKTFPKYFNQSNVNKYARKPQLIANRVYGGRMGNGPESSGEGFMYRGRGIFQITGKANYEVIGEMMGMDLISDPDLLLEPINAAYSAAAYWAKRGLNQYADDDDVKTITKKINGGFIGLAEREKLVDIAKQALGV